MNLVGNGLVRLLVVILLLSVSTARAQETTATITGQVMDASGAVVSVPRQS